jgi:hypothetical protein
MARLSDFELGWLVGILEGEGYFGYECTQRVQVKMTDEDSVVRAAALFERITEQTCLVLYEDKSKYNVNWQDAWKVVITGDRARIVMRYVVKYMGYRRRQRIWQCLNKHKEEKQTFNLVELLNVKKGA